MRTVSEALSITKGALAQPRAHPTSAKRPTSRGKFLYTANQKLYVKGVTYGTFRPRPDGSEYGHPISVEEDFRAIARHGMNAIRTYTAPPDWVLETALKHGLYVMVGLPWEQHVAFLDERSRRNSIENRIRDAVRARRHHPNILSYAIGNEIPASVVRWYGRKRVEKFLLQLFNAVKETDPDSLVTYVNYPSTEYLQLPFLDFFSFNVYLEDRQNLDRYLARLHNIADDRPLLLTEVGLDSRRNGEAAQAQTLDWQIRSVFSSGCAGTFLFAWTDEWHRGGHDIEDWDFGLTRRDRQPKPALAASMRAFAEVPPVLNGQSSRVSVVICAYNAESTIGETLTALRQLSYPNYEVIVVDDGSQDATSTIAGRFDVRLVHTENRGLAAARNTGMELATGEIIAYLDADAYPDDQWLTHLTQAFARGGYAAVGGPNIPPPDDGTVAACVAEAPGGPIHVLVTDTEAEHIPGCNMAVRKKHLRAIGGFDPQFRAAGDDVDVCWRLLDQGWKIGFTPGAVVWHHRRTTVSGYWKQQVGYGKAEGMLEKKWPEKYNRLGHIPWHGRLYGTGHAHALSIGRWRVYHGVWGTAPFQSMYTRATGRWLSLPLMPEWYYIVAGLAVLSAMALLWTPLIVAIPLLIAAVAAQVSQAFYSAAKARSRCGPGPGGKIGLAFALTTLLHVLQPLARLWGRLKYGLTPWRRRKGYSFVFPRPQSYAHWHETWQSPEEILRSLESELRAAGPAVIRGGDFDRWDLEVRAGTTGSVRLRMMGEEHGGGKQLIRFSWWPICSLNRFTISASIITLGALALLRDAWLAGTLIGSVGLWLAFLAFWDCVASSSVIENSLKANRKARRPESEQTL